MGIMETKMNEYVHIPLGTRCSTAYIFRDNLKLREISLPFDWVDIPIGNVKQFIEIEREQIPSFVHDYFHQIPKTWDKHPDGTWFPHDSFNGEVYHDAINDIIDKYTRRFERLHDLFKSEKTLVFLTTFAQHNTSNHQEYVDLMELLCKKMSKKSVFIAINLYYTNINSHYSPYLNGSQFYNYYIEKENGDMEFKKFEADIANKISTDEWTKKYFL